MKITALGQKCDAEEYENCADCIVVLCSPIKEIFALTTLKATVKFESIEKALDKFDKRWEKFEKCWIQKTGQPATQTELDELKEVFTSTLISCVEGVIQAQDAPKDKKGEEPQKNTDNKDKRREKENKKKAEKKAAK